MMPFENLYNNLFPQGKNNVTPDLAGIVEEYPYFGLAHFFHLKQTSQEGSASPMLVAKTALHFNNAHLLNYQLNKAVINAADETDSYQAGVGEPDPRLLTKENIPVEALKSSAVELSPENPAQVDDLIEDTDGGLKVELRSPEASADDIIAAVPEEENEDETLFEPLHTTDYFASQGIKMSEEVQPTDRLGIQLKSFTQWLKTMKKVHQSKLPEGSEQQDATVNRLAEKSNLETEVVTEAMAEAFILQGKPLKAKDIYLKLSLLNPSKNAYFAAKLEQIK